MRRAIVATFSLLTIVVSVQYAFADGADCLITLSATASNATVSRGNRFVTAVADSSGMCTFTLNACVNDTTVAACNPGTVNKLRVLATGRGSSLTGLGQDLQSKLPTATRTCSQITVPMGQTLHRRVLMAVGTADGRSDSSSLTLICQCPAGTGTYGSTFQLIQQAIFENHGCTNSTCHGAAKQGGLDLTAGNAYQNLFQVPSSESVFNRVQPGDERRSYLWLKLAAKTDPTLLPPGIDIATPMPLAPLPALSADEIEALRLWIYSGAPQAGTVAGADTLLNANACLPPPEPIIITPLDPPPAGQGVQFVMPPWHLEANSQHEICFATYYDVTDQVPPQFQDPSGTMFRFNENVLRQDPQSHHLLLNRYIGSASDIHDPSFGSWTCNGGPNAGQVCEPTNLTSCGSGTCTSAIQQSFACIGFGPQTGAGTTFVAIGGAQQAQSDTQFVDGVFGQIPMKGILYWNSHAFNLTNEDTTMHARLNYIFANNDQYPVQPIFDTSDIFFFKDPPTLPYTTQTICNDYPLPQGARLFALSSHTHKHGKHFTIAVPGGTTVYENFVFNDPANLTFNPPLQFDSPTVAQRTLHYCSLYNNGVAADGSPDPTAVTRYSMIPQSAIDTFGACTPIACAAGKVGAPCHGVGDDRTCDSAPGALDGSCDACSIKGGESTENEMFILIGSYYLDPTVVAAQGGVLNPALRTNAVGRSLSTEMAVPAQLGCGSSHAGHAMHGAHQPH